MARIRSIKPEFWTSGQIGELSPIGRLLFVGMWTFCDDHGVHPASCKTLKAEVFPFDDITSAEIEGLVAKLIEQGLIIEYQCIAGKKWWHVTGWQKHQRVDKPNRKHQAPPIFDDHSMTIRRPFDDHSTPEGRGREGRGNGGEMEMEGKGGEPAHTREEDFSTTTPPQPAFFQNSPSTPTPVAHSNDFAAVRSAIRQWEQQDDGAALRQMAQDQKYLGPIDQEITRFITSNLRKPKYRQEMLDNPLLFFLDQFPGWLCLPVAQRISKEYSTQQAANRPTQGQTPENHQQSAARVESLIKAHAGDIADQFTDRHRQSIAAKTNATTAVELIHAIAKTIRNGPPAHRTNGHEVDITTIAQNKLIGL